MGADRATRIVLAHRLLRRYVLPGERVVLATRRHWAKLLEPALTALAVLVLVAWLTVLLQPALGDRALWLWWLWLAALARLGWLVLVWRVEWFVATDKRMLLLTGLVTHQIGMMPLMKVTDMRYSRSVLGQLLGYGQFLLESAGQDQALRSIDWVARPDATYRDLCALIFTPVDGPRRDGEDGPVRPAAAGLPLPTTWPPTTWPPTTWPATTWPSTTGPTTTAPTTTGSRPPALPPARVPRPAGAPGPGEADTQPVPTGPAPGRRGRGHRCTARALRRAARRRGAAAHARRGGGVPAGGRGRGHRRRGRAARRAGGRRRACLGRLRADGHVRAPRAAREGPGAAGGVRADVVHDPAAPPSAGPDAGKGAGQGSGPA
ncbi:PH domain-containing protein [Cellulomonas sp. JZ18]|uniref:PH domain-containing protein n=1 Tax=Cellulomonas sp. JZ18 TaxID=2654191 RepID=UPI0012D3E966|nr:PH domain-containing protein [Cellulomonas sp. JZ18]QGQ20171.1 PH domain-containing protein [Cellulomonas sp. JZ18]